MEKTKKIFGVIVKKTKDGKRHLGAVIGSPKYKGEYCEIMVNGWTGELENLADIGKLQPQTAYIAYKCKLTYFMRIIGLQENRKSC